MSRCQFEPFQCKIMGPLPSSAPTIHTSFALCPCTESNDASGNCATNCQCASDVEASAWPSRLGVSSVWTEASSLSRVSCMPPSSRAAEASTAAAVGEYDASWVSAGASVAGGAACVPLQANESVRVAQLAQTPMRKRAVTSPSMHAEHALGML